MPVLNTDPVNLEQTVSGAIKDRLLTVPLIAQYCRVWERERFPESDLDDLEISTVPDPSQSDIRMTSVLEIGMPSVRETEYTGEQCTQLRFDYPLVLTMQVKDEWNNEDGGLVYTNSRSLFMAMYMLARKAFKDNRVLGGFENCVHEYLQLDSAQTAEDEETGGRLHVGDWSLVVYVKGVIV